MSISLNYATSLLWMHEKKLRGDGCLADVRGFVLLLHVLTTGVPIHLLL